MCENLCMQHACASTCSCVRAPTHVIPRTSYLRRFVWLPIIRRRLPVIMVRIKMAETVKQAAMLVEQGHVRVGPRTVTDPAMLITRTMEDFVTWVDTSKIKRAVTKYNDKLDDYDLLN